MENYSRRYVLSASLWTFGALCFGLPRIIAGAREPRNAARGRLNWDEFVDKLEREARSQHSAAWNTAAYVESVSELLREIKPSDAALRRATALHSSPVFLKPDFAELLKTTDVQISLITFGKGESLPHHDHPSMTGVLTCATGDLFVASYDRVRIPETALPSILLKRARTEVIAPGKVSTLTNTRRNVHFVKALSFTQVIDIFTPPYNADRTSKTNWYRLEQRPVQGHRDLFIAYPYH